MNKNKRSTQPTEDHLSHVCPTHKKKKKKKKEQKKKKKNQKTRKTPQKQNKTKQKNPQNPKQMEKRILILSSFLLCYGWTTFRISKKEILFILTQVRSKHQILVSCTSKMVLGGWKRFLVAFITFKQRNVIVLKGTSATHKKEMEFKGSLFWFVPHVEITLFFL